MNEIVREVKGIPTSFVAKNMKFDDDQGSGEARLFLGNKLEFTNLNNFFGTGNYEGKYEPIKYTVRFDRDNFLDYMKYVKLEHVFQHFHKYKGANLDEWTKIFNEVSKLADEDFVVKLYTVNDKNRYYVRADEKIFMNYLRGIVVPRITNLTFIKDEDIKTIHIRLDINYSYNNTSELCSETQVDKDDYISFASNILLYGVPGCGKSHYVEQEYERQITDNQFKVRVVFHPDYTNSDFVGQIMPVLKTEYKDNGEKEEKLKYEFVEGPFTRILMAAEANPTEKCLLIIEELNRGNAPAIFGEVFQLLDRDDDGTSKYAIYNRDIAEKVYDDPLHPIKIPSNISIIATMNTSDQNVFTMDTAFQRRWQMKHIPNKFEGKGLNEETKKHVAKLVPGSSISWGVFATTVNSKMGKASLGFAGTEDKSLGVYFATDKDLDSKDIFAEKVLKYLWDDAFKMGRSELFKEPERSLSYILETFDETKEDALKAVLLDSVYKEMEEKMLAAEELEPVEEAESVDAEPAEEE